STPLFAGIEEEMNEEELALSRSTPGYRFDRPAVVPAPAPLAEPVATLDGEAERFVDARLAEAPVVMFALAWCEFCWAARLLFEGLGI
ncbi:hypothetical protein P8631_19410, partial [Guyparkeria sp. 1SP6A2]|nr:hypothetical protein [Guyparkeria sp. 1SP6A2]